MLATAHLTIHLPASISPAVHIVGRLTGAIIVTLLAPLASVVFIVGALALALALATVL